MPSLAQVSPTPRNARRKTSTVSDVQNDNELLINHAQEVNDKDTKEFIEFVKDTVLQSIDVSQRRWSQVQGDAPLPPKTQKYLNALHTSNLLLQKRTKAYFLVVNSDDQPLQAQEEAQTGGDEKAPRSPSRLLWKKVQEKLTNIVISGLL